MRRLVVPILSAMLSMPVSMRAQCNTMGMDFWLSYPYYESAGNGPAKVSVLAAGPRPCTVTISNPHSGYVVSMNVVPGQVAERTLNYSEAVTEVSGVPVWKGLRVSSTDSIALYAVVEGDNGMDSTLGITLVLPTKALGPHYWVKGLIDGYGTPVTFRNPFVVVAVDTGTTIVDITPTAWTSNGFPPDVTQSIMLQQGQVCQIDELMPEDTTTSGCEVHARLGKRVAVFFGHYSTIEPNPDYSNTGDYHFDNILPMHLCGDEYATYRLYLGEDRRDTYLVLSPYDSCDLYWVGNHGGNMGQPWITFGAGQWLSYTCPDSGIYQRSSRPLSLYWIPHHDRISYAYHIYGSAMTPVPPTERFVKSTTFVTKSYGNLMSHYVNIVAYTYSVGDMTLDGVNIGNAFTAAIPGRPELMAAHILLTDGVHTLSTTRGEGFGAISYGEGLGKSYATCTGIRISQHAEGFLTLNGTEVDDVYYCIGGDPAVIRAESNLEYDSVVWYIDNVRHSKGDSFRCSDTGCHTLTARFMFPERIECLDSSMLIRQVRICAYPTYEQHVYDTSSIGNLPRHFAGRDYYESVEHDTIRLTTSRNCDSVIIYSLYVYDENDTIREYYYDTVCTGTPYTGHGFIVEAGDEPGTTTYIHRDSIHVHTLYLTRVAPPGLSILHDYFQDGFYLLSAQTDAPYLHWWAEPRDVELTEELCRQRSIVVNPREETAYHLHACSVADEGCCTDDSLTLQKRSRCSLHVPNIFTPENGTNNRFKVIGSGITEFEIYIYHKWGTIAYHSTDINEGWDGTHNGGKCPQGSYAYIIFYKDETTIKDRQVKTGSVTLLR